MMMMMMSKSPNKKSSTRSRIFHTLICCSLVYFAIKAYKRNTAEHSLLCRETSHGGSEKQMKCSSLPFCQAKTNIVFLKTHKTGSTTVQNIFLRYGDTNDLTFALPLGDIYFGHPQPFARSMVSPNVNKSFASSSYNILAHHARLNYSEMKYLMPNNTIFVTILRNPVCLIESIFCYWNVKRERNQTSCTKTMVNYFSTLPNVTYHNHSLRGRVTRIVGFNQMSFDLGFEPANANRPGMADKFIQDLDSQFHLVMILDRIDESLILLKHLLCWSLNDVIVFKHNGRNDNESCSFSTATKDKIRIFNPVDQRLYNYFLAKHERHVAAFGKQRMANEVAELQQATATMYDKCVQAKLPMNEIVGKGGLPFNAKSFGYRRKQNVDKTCQALTMYGRLYTDYLRNKSGDYTYLKSPMTQLLKQRGRLILHQNGNKSLIPIH